MTGQELQQWREVNGYSQREFGQLFGKSHGMARHWETGVVRIPPEVANFVRYGTLPHEQRRGSRQLRSWHTPLCGHPCHPCAKRRLWLAGRYANRPHPPCANAWDATQDQRLRQLASQETLAAIGQRLTAEFGVLRTAHAVRQRLAALGLSTGTVHYTAYDVGRLCGVAPQTVVRWVGKGWLQTHGQRTGRKGHYQIPADALEAILRTRPYIVDRTTMPRSRWRQLVEAEWVRDPWYTLTETATLFRLTAWRVRWAVQCGDLPAERPHITCPRRLVIRRSAILAWLKAREAA